jgi:uridine kinase
MSRSSVQMITTATIAAQRAELGITALHPDCNYLDIMQHHLSQLRIGQPIPQANLQPQNRHI